MTNLEIYNRMFIRDLRVKEEDLPGLKYRGIRTWDSLGHMDLIADLEEKYDIHISTSDVMNFSSYEKGMEVLAKYGVII
ncbi:acyl carrier protein [Lacrimispora algidixylanolytica]|uniref:Acyl carrier protein n=1 Tax=Lacrimispora algidixylanolytica TaxID=94868 RepID=A0A419SY91_9FIRM|nr:acyl carrier protein [Lacrimispora algidixylanolytica]RKD30165.1 acyl carrier protein [Lacrimispora algidixylanolytica]